MKALLSEQIVPKEIPVICLWPLDAGPESEVGWGSHCVEGQTLGRQQVAAERIQNLTILERNSGHTGCVTMDKIPNSSGYQFLKL